MNEISEIMGFTAFISFLPISVYVLRRHPHGGIYWILLLCPLIASITLCLFRFSGAWHSDFITSIWVSIATSIFLFAIIASFSEKMRRLTVLFLPYMALFAASATLWSFVISTGSYEKISHPADNPWLIVHIISSVLTYALITLAATAALAVYIRERTLKAKTKSGFVDLLPAMADSEELQIRLMIASEIILGAGLVTGLAAKIMLGENLLSIDHKILLSFAAFIVMGLLLIAHYKTGIRGQKAARFLLLSYLLVTMGFPGVKFVTDILMRG